MRRIKYEGGIGEDDYVDKCMKCKHSYTRQNDSDTLFCRCRNGKCNYQESKPRLKEMEG